MQAFNGVASALMQPFLSFVHPTNSFHISNRFSRCSSKLYRLGWGLVITAPALWYLNLFGVPFGCRHAAGSELQPHLGTKTGTMQLLLAVLQSEIPNASLVLDQGLDIFT